MTENSSDTKKTQTLAEPDLLAALTELANLRDDPADFERLIKRWPGLVYVDDNAYRLINGEEVPYKFGNLVERRDAVRAIWQGDFLTLKELLLPVDPPQELQDKYYDRITPLEENEDRSGRLWDTQIEVDWEGGRFVYEPRTDFQRALYQLLRKSALVKVCANPGCPAPYFVAAKATQRYCSDKCAEIFQRAWKRRWWAEHGEKWRSSRKRSKKKATRGRATRRRSTTPTLRGPAS